jgi:hypothetical protein
MRDDSTDFGKAIRRLIQQQALRRAANRARTAKVSASGETHPFSGPEIFPSKTPRGDWDQFVVPGPEGLH